MDSKRSHAMYVLLLFLTPMVWNAVRAQQPVAESVLIGPGDLIHLQVFDAPEFDQSARVTDSGMVPLLLGSPVKVAGLDVSDAARVIEQALETGKYILHPHVAVTIQDLVSNKVSVIGEVKTPGSLALQTPQSILQVIAMSGGLLDTADRNIVIQRHDTQEKVHYMLSNTANAAFDNSTIVYPGDTVYVAKAGIVYILGDVRMPGGYTMTNPESQVTILQLVARAGGLNVTAVSERAVLIRKSKDGYVQMPLQLAKMEKGKLQDRLMQPGDVIYVPFSYLKNFAVNAPGVTAAVGSAAVYRF